MVRATVALDRLKDNDIPAGLLNANILELFRASRIAKISLSESFKDVNGLNLVSDDSFFGTSSILLFTTSLSLYSV